MNQAPSYGCVRQSQGQLNSTVLFFRQLAVLGYLGVPPVAKQLEGTKNISLEVTLVHADTVLQGYFPG